MFEGLEDRISLTADVWTGGQAKTNQDFNFSNPGNWSQNVAPVSGQDLIFPSASGSTFIPTSAITNDLSNMTFNSITIDAPGYTIAGDPITLTAGPGIVANYGTGVSAYSINTDLVQSGVLVASGGELDIDGTISGSNGFDLTGGGILGGTGQVPSLAVQGSALQPGAAGSGTLTVQGGASVDATSTFTTFISAAGTNTALVGTEGANSPVVLDLPALSVIVAPGYIPTPGTSFTVVQGSVEGQFNGLPEGSTLTTGAGGPTFRVTYDQGAVLTAVTPTSVVTTVQGGSTTSVFGQSVTFVATITDAGGNPTGTVTFDDGTSVLGTGTVNSGVAMFTATQLAVGPHAITAVYSGDARTGGSTSPVLAQTVNDARTTTTVTSPTNPSASGQNVTFTATVLPVSPGSGTPTGTVTFFDGSSELGVVPMSGGIGMYSTTALTLGTHAISAVYSGDFNFVGSGSPAIVQNVTKAASLTLLASSANPSDFGQTVTFTAQVEPTASESGTPTGSINFFDGSTELGTVALSGGIATYTTSDLPKGANSISAVYSGDSNFAASTAGLSENVNQASTETVVTPSPSASVAGQSVTLTAQVLPVSPGAGVPTGTLTFKDGTTTLGIATLSGGSASISTSSLAVGSHSITGVYSGDSDDFLTSTSSPSIELVGGTTVALVSSTSPSNFGQSVTFTATVAADAAGSSVPVGSVTFMDGTQSLGTFTIDGSGVASVSTASLSGGTHEITAVYGGGTDFASSTSSPLAQVVNQVNTTTTLGVPSGTSTFGQTVTFTATVAGASGASAGSVVFKDGTSVLATVPVNASGIATYSSTLAVGAHLLAADYSGSDSFLPSASTTLAFSVGQATTTTALARSTATPLVGQLVTFTATVAAVAPGAGVPSGTVVFHEGSTVLGTASVSAGVASLAVALSGVGTGQTIEATYSGSPGYAGSTSAGETVTVEQGTPTTTLVATPDFVGSKARKVTLTVLVQSGVSGVPVPSGSVVFDIGRRTLRTLPLVDGSASVVLSSRKATNETFVVHYRGDADYKAAVSSGVHIRRSFFKAKPAARRSGV